MVLAVSVIEFALINYKQMILLNCFFAGKAVVIISVLAEIYLRALQKDKRKLEICACDTENEYEESTQSCE